MVNLPWFIPQLRHVDDKNTYKNVVSDNEGETLALDDGITAFKNEDGKYYKIKEFRDEAKRPWWKFFDEFEYREPTDLASRRKWYQWFEPGTSAQEKKLILKLDLLIAFYSFLSYWIKYLDSSNLNSAYVSGMKETLGMKGNDLVHTQVVFNVGNIIFELPMMYILPRLPSNYVLLVSEFGWSVFTLFLYAVKNVSQLQALRFFVGSFEAAFFPTIHYVLASWYKSSEIARRGALFYCGQFLGVLTAGLLQSAVYTNLDGHNGLEGWRWCFLIDGLISVFVAILGFFMLPGTPFNCYSIFLTDEEIVLARQRMYLNGNDTSPTPVSFFDKKTWKNVFTSWQVYLLAVIQFQGFNTNNTSSGSFLLWLKSLKKYSIGRLNNLSACPPAVGIAYVLIICFGADLTQKRFGFIIFSFIMNFIGNCILAIWDVPIGAKWYGFMSAYWSWSQSSVFNPLISDLFRKNNNERAIGWMAQYIFGLQSTAWMPLLIFPTVDSPKFQKGFITCAVFSLTFCLCLSGVYFLYKRDERKEALENGIYLYNSTNEGVPEFVLKHQNAIEGRLDSEETSIIHSEKDGDKKSNSLNDAVVDSNSSQKKLQ